MWNHFETIPERYRQRSVTDVILMPYSQPSIQIDGWLTTVYIDRRLAKNDDQHSLAFTYNWMCMKLFKSSSIDLVKECRSYFCRVMPSITVEYRSKKFIAKYSDNTFCHFWSLL